MYLDSFGAKISEQFLSKVSAKIERKREKRLSMNAWKKKNNLRERIEKAKSLREKEKLV